MRVNWQLTTLLSFYPSWDNMVFLNKGLTKYLYVYVLSLSFMEIYLQYDHFLYSVICFQMLIHRIIKVGKDL